MMKRKEMCICKSSRQAAGLQNVSATPGHACAMRTGRRAGALRCAVQGAALACLWAACALAATMPTRAAAPAGDEPLRYEILCAGVGADDQYLVEVSAYVAKKKEIGYEAVKRAAVHGALFRGVAPNKAKGCRAQPAMLRAQDEAANADFFKAFFADGEYGKFASSVEGTLRTARMGKGYYVTAICLVNKVSLRHAMEDAGVLRRLGI